ncbi:MAG: hypothetical protein AB8B96_00780 [Lysobacterales bacterium]
MRRPLASAIAALCLCAACVSTETNAPVGESAISNQPALTQSRFANARRLLQPQAEVIGNLKPLSPASPGNGD